MTSEIPNVCYLESWNFDFGGEWIAISKIELWNCGKWTCVLSKSKSSIARKLELVVPKSESSRIGKLDRNCSKLDVRFAEILNFHCMKFGASLIKIHMFGYREIGRFCRSPKPLLFENWSQLYQNPKVRALGNWILIVGNWTCVLPKS